jgi:hypothetical protein
MLVAVSQNRCSAWPIRIREAGSSRSRHGVFVNMVKCAAQASPGMRSISTRASTGPPYRLINFIERQSRITQRMSRRLTGSSPTAFTGMPNRLKS